MTTHYYVQLDLGYMEAVESQFLARLQRSFAAINYDAKQPSTQYSRFMLRRTFFYEDVIAFMSSLVHTLLLNGYLSF